ncbi:hypothetical protein ABZZ79_38995 [Streptomyces sp. NPDC006458]|uniref:hypothetical protein n=1 Tax=Streptomyces sp. NPDC006458 TaxID=3154302 RepID=UPI0033B3391C
MSAQGQPLRGRPGAGLLNRERALYGPAPVLRTGINEIVVLELHAAHRARTVSLRETPDLGPTEE